MKKLLKVIGLLLLIISIPVLVNGDPVDSNFLAAKKALTRGDKDNFFSLREEMLDHPLQPYLDYYYIRQNFNSLDDSVIEQYIHLHTKSPMANKLRVQLQNEFIKNKQWNEFLAIYQPSRKTSEQCDYLMALHKTGDKEKASPAIKTLWLTSKSRPDNCTPLFNLWLSHASNKDDLIWERFEIALLDKNTSLAKSLLKRFSKKKKSEAQQVLRVFKNPKLVNNKSFLKKVSSPEVISFGIARLARLNPVDGVNAWKRLKQRYTFNDAQEQRIFQAVGLAMVLRKNRNSTKWFRKVINADLPPVYKDWMMRAGIILGDWQFVLDCVDAQPDDEKNSLRSQYWYGRALGQLGKKAESRKVLGKISQERNYYGFLANYHLNQPINVKHEALEITPKELATVKNTPGFQRATLLYELNLKHDARVELFTLMKHMTEKEQYIVTKLISEWGWHPQALRLSHYADHKDDITIRFPLPYKDLVTRHAKKYGVESALIYAIMRQESYFTPYANSPAGAMGLMQLMPATASRTAKQFSLRYKNKKDLFDGPKNIQLGSAHIKKLHQQFNSHPALVIAAYNAGKTAANRWRSRYKGMPTDIWIETVGYRETRNYLRNVIACYVVYQHRLGHKPSLDRIMRPIR